MTTAINEKCADWQFRAEVAARFSEPVYLPSYTVATLPAASAWPQCLVYVSDGTGDQRLGVSDGTDWRFPDGSVVS